MLIIKKLICLLLLSSLALPYAAPGAQAAPEISAQRAVLMRADGEILFARGAGERALIASTTKLMTAIVAIELLDPDKLVDITYECCAVEGSSMYLEPGRRYTVRQLLEGLLLVSGNDAALALAEAAGGEGIFVDQMNELARALSLRDTHFANPHGLDAEEHYSTASDLACLMAYCMANECFAAIIRERDTVVKGNCYVNHNKLLESCPGCIGGKTGYTRAAGRCLVSCCERAGARLICVTLNDPDDWEDHRALYDWGFSQIAQRRGSGLRSAGKAGESLPALRQTE